MNEFTFYHAISDNNSFESHSHLFVEMLLFLRGDAYHVVEDRKYRLNKNDFVLIRPKVFHYIDMISDSEYERYIIQFDPSILDGIDCEKIFSRINVINCPEKSIINNNIHKMEYYQKCFDREKFLSVSTMLIKEIFYNLSEIDDNANNAQIQLGPLLSEVLYYINENLHTIRDLSEVSDALHVSQSYIHRMFRHHIKITPKKYITDKRLLEARAAILAGEKPSEIYAEVGFQEYSTFYRCYKQKFGYSPSME